MSTQTERVLEVCATGVGLETAQKKLSDVPAARVRAIFNVDQEARRRLASEAAKTGTAGFEGYVTSRMAKLSGTPKEPKALKASSNKAARAAEKVGHLDAMKAEAAALKEWEKAGKPVDKGNEQVRSAAAARVEVSRARTASNAAKVASKKSEEAAAEAKIAEVKASAGKRQVTPQPQQEVADGPQVIVS